jgi:TnpA family transposase
MSKTHPQVATKRVKHAIKSDIPSVTDSVSKLVHIGKATVEKLHNLRQAATEEGFAIQVCMGFRGGLKKGLCHYTKFNICASRSADSLNPCLLPACRKPLFSEDR